LASTSSNKTPMMVDRPLHAFAKVGTSAALSSSSDLTTLVGNGCRLLVDCSSNDGAVIDSVSVIENNNSVSSVRVCLFLSVATSSADITNTNTAYVAGVTISGAGTAGLRTNIPLPPLSVPVPCLASPAINIDQYPNEVEKKNTGLYVPSGALVYVGVSQVISSPSGAQVTVFAQGGFF
jgi:hypothetical protein